MSNWYLEVTSFRGVSWNAQHWYGKLKKEEYRRVFGGPNPLPSPSEFEIELLLTEEQATELNEAEKMSMLYDEANPTNFVWKAGMETHRWSDETALRTAGVEKFLEVAESGDELLLGMSYCVDNESIATKE